MLKRGPTRVKNHSQFLDNKFADQPGQIHTFLCHNLFWTWCLNRIFGIIFNLLQISFENLKIFSFDPEFSQKIKNLHRIIDFDAGQRISSFLCGFFRYCKKYWPFKYLPGQPESITQPFFNIPSQNLNTKSVRIYRLWIASIY